MSFQFCAMMQVRRLVAQNVDFECLLESVPGWNKGVGTEVVRQHVRWGIILLIQVAQLSQKQKNVAEKNVTRKLQIT